ncbi:HPr family phosphocarrier protein [Telmatospirillum sp. J64-1]|uniref:HPr family phosphocarrier protein n=1 Tax=Telmatospirillum sp. J64-1 TaxID=2502183 RepID=UPI00115EABE8|nr:HPr family phosphocarrier protein [Telmatospirillum sp. J64-1]
MDQTAATPGEEQRRNATITNRRGLHARAAAKFVKLAGQFNAQVTVAKKGTEVSGLSIMGLMMLAAGPGCTIELRAQGPQAAEALVALVALIDGKFDED